MKSIALISLLALLLLITGCGDNWDIISITPSEYESLTANSAEIIIEINTNGEEISTDSDEYSLILREFDAQNGVSEIPLPIPTITDGQFSSEVRVVTYDIANLLDDGQGYELELRLKRNGKNKNLITETINFFTKEGGQNLCYDNSQCEDGDHCGLIGNACGEVGVCTKSFLECIAIDEQCGCDGTFYINSCDALNNGIAVDEDMNNCAIPECSSNSDCNNGYFCEKTACGDAKGQCVMKPVACPAYYAPVCGCDGNDYGNPCYMRKAGTNKQYDGTCN